MKKYIFGVDLGGTTVKNGIFTMEGRLLHKWEIPTDISNNGINILPDIVSSCRGKAEECGLAYEDFLGIGIGVPGAVDKEGNVHGCVNLGWGYTRVKETMEQLSGLRVEVNNDANLAALGEMWQGAAKGRRNVVMVTIGTGLGGGVITEGNLIIGAHGYAAEIGHMRVELREEEYCNCGKQGCLEQYCSATGIAHQAELALNRSDASSILREVNPVTAKDVFDAAKADDAFAILQVETFGRRMAMGLSYIACVTDPEVFVLGGGVSGAGGILTEVIRRYYGDFTFGRQKEVEFVLAELGNDAGIYGAAKLIIS